MLIILISLFVSQIFCYYVLDDILVVLFHPIPIVYIINRILISLTLITLTSSIRNRKLSKNQIDIVFTFYLIFILGFLFLKGNMYTQSGFRININPLNIVNDIKTSSNAILLLIGNTILYIPFGIYFKYRILQNRKKFTIFFIAIPLLIEVVQLLTGVGVFDINDIILNSIGITVGITIYRVMLQERENVKN